MDLLTPNSSLSLRTDQCVEPSFGFCCALRITRLCTAGVALRGLLPLCCPCSPSMPNCLKRPFHFDTVGALAPSASSIWR